MAIDDTPRAQLDGIPPRGTVVALVPDMFFAVAIRQAAKRLDFDTHVVRTPEQMVDSLMLDNPVLAVVDLHAVGAHGDWDAIREVKDSGVPVLVFGPHKDVDGLRAAKDAGVTRVVSNGNFHRVMTTLIERYARDDEDTSDTISHVSSGDLTHAEAR